MEPVIRRPHRHDLLIAAAGLLGGVLLWLLDLRMQNGRPFEAPWAGLLFLVPMAAAELMRRTRPGAALALAVAGLAEMRRLIGLLRRGGAPDMPGAAPRLSALDALIEQSRAHAASSGLTCVLDDARGGGVLPAPAELAAYRIVQESLTNALKHAAAGAVRVRLARPGGLLTVEVTSVSGARKGPRAPGSGTGLIGMRERAELLGGTIRAGEERAADGTALWRVRAELPVSIGKGEGTMSS
ncbi:hypothetical protein OHT52_07740 [Streptomyces sp. NBC_00247]|uniref:sensor histidine kinase n=1 Tax=Streptomyces sp. NBC_00247 TaxID=2975689 RepID=UPI002E2E4228|nr:ATP-binding protein [Streptomyces sp. NBC_00247]